MADQKQKNEGEGGKTAAKQYDDAAEKFAQSGKVDKQAQDARRALDTSESTELREAEIDGKRRIAEEDPEITRHEKT